MNSVTLDNRIYILQNSELPQELKEKVTEADKNYLQDNNGKANELCEYVEKQCKLLGIQLFNPSFNFNN
jgi:predicted house-cleaning noncanonical NTP pyrophosphatase (MazG superfamily)